MIDHDTRLKENEDLSLQGAPVSRKKAPGFDNHRMACDPD